MVEEERLDSSPERAHRQRMERKNQVAAERDSGNDSTSSQDKRKRQSQEDDNDNCDDCSSESESDSGEEESQSENEGKENCTSDSSCDSSSKSKSDKNYGNDDSQGSDDKDSDGGEYSETHFVQRCVNLRYATSSRTGFDQRYKTMKKWLRRHAKHYLPLQNPFPDSLCILWCHHQMKRKNKKGDLLGPGNLFAHIQMLKFKGFTSVHETVPPKLEAFFKNAHEAHKRVVMELVDDCKQSLPDSHAQNASWQAIQYACEKTHDWMPGRGHDLRTNLFLTGAIQTISRGERVGKVPTMAFRMGHSGDHICAGEGLSSKTNQKGNLSYDKRFWANYTNGKMCFVNALGRHLLGQKKKQLSTFLFMSKTEAEQYLRKLEISRKKKNHKDSNVGPHLKFDRLLAKVFKKLPSRTRIAMGISKTKNFVGHCKRKAAFARAVDGDGPDANMIGNRADHKTNNHRTYSARGIFGVKGSGGPPARHDITISKLLAGLTQYTPEFNAVPPHWDTHTIEEIEWKHIMPCYEELPEGMQALVPFAVAQVVYHYHKSNCGLSSSHDLFKSPLWTTHHQLRTDLYDALRGADTGQPSVLSTTYCDKETDVYLWTKDCHKTIIEMKKDISELKTMQREQMNMQEDIKRRLDRQGCNPVEDQQHDSNGMNGIADGYDGRPSEQDCRIPPEPLHQRQHQHQPSASNCLVLPDPPAGFAIANGINVETAWHGWHGSYHNDATGGGPSYPWKKINPDSACLDIFTKRKTLQQLSKIRVLVAFLQGDTDDKREREIEKDVSHAWDVCKESAMETLKAQGITEWPLSGSFKTAYMALLKLKKEQKKTFLKVASRAVDTTPQKPLRLQSRITNYFGQSGNLLDVDVDVEEQHGVDPDIDHPGASSGEEIGFDLFGTSSRAARDCYICPHCPESGGAEGRDLVVYSDSNALWQHWNAHHMGDPRPALWEIHRVQGVKLVQSRTTPWTRVEGAWSFRDPDYKLKKMRQDIKSGSRKLEQGTYVELQPNQQAKAAGITWFAIVRDGRVIDGKITVEFCADNCLTIQRGQMQKVWVESILRVGDSPHRPFEDVPVSTPSARATKSGTPRNQPSLTTPSPDKLCKQFSPSKSYRKETATFSVKKAKVDCASLSEINDDKKIQTDDPASPAETNPHDETARSIHADLIRTIVARITRKTNKDETALKQFSTANELLERAGWIRCKTSEYSVSYANLMHPKYSVKKMPRDGKCMYHCMLAILEAEREMRAPPTAKEFREQLANYAESQVPPKGTATSKYGGILYDGVYLPLEESIRATYGGEAVIAVFVQLYGITVHVIAPECNARVVTHKGDGRSANEYYMLQTLSWQTWNPNDKYDPAKKGTITSYERGYSGDHWQLLEPASKELQCGEGSQKKGNLASASSAAPTAPKQPQQRVAAVAPQHLQFGDSVQSSDRERAGAAEIALKSSHARTQLEDANRLQENAPMKSFVGSTDVQLMMRAVTSDPYVYNPIPKLKHKDPPTNIGGLEFVEHDFGNYFHGAYRSGTAKVLHAFPDLNENNRSFFLALGMGAGMDPFMLQCLFRTQAERLKSNPNIGQKNHMTTLLTPNKAIDYNVLKWCWPPEFDDIAVLVVERQQTRFVLFETEPTRQRKMIILSRDKECAYQLLLLNPETKEEAEAVLRKHATKIPLNESISDTERCQSICTLSKFDMYEEEHVYLAAALPGSEPLEHEYNAIWERALEACCLECDPVTESWTRVPTWFAVNQQITKKKSHVKDGSLRQSSWKLLRSKLVEAFDAETSTSSDVREHKGTEKMCLRSALNSPARQTKDSSSSSLPCVFLDCGSEAGRGMFQMMQSNRINHIAGIELQNSWFRVSIFLMKYVRREFQKQGYRMPEVTLINSCMCAQTPLLTWIYSVTSIIWMNNFVFDKCPYFNSRDPKSAESSAKALVPGIESNTLSINAAKNLSLRLEGTTLIAVHNASAFANDWNYTHSKPIDVSCTWSGFDASGLATKETVTILKHMQHLQIARGFHLRSVNAADLNALETWENNWSAFIHAATLNYDPEDLQAIEFEHRNDKVTSKELATLGHGRWLMSDVIHAYMYVLESHFQDIHFCVTNVVDLHKRKMMSLDKMFGKHDRIIFCRNINDNHWIGIKLEKKEKSITICDSLLGKNEDSFVEIQKLANSIGIVGQLKRILVKVPNQINCNDCGVTTCLFMLCMAYNVENELTYDDSRFVSRHFRQRLFADIVKKTVTPLQKQNR